MTWDMHEQWNKRRKKLIRELDLEFSVRETHLRTQRAELQVVTERLSDSRRENSRLREVDKAWGATLQQAGLENDKLRAEKAELVAFIKKEWPECDWPEFIRE